MSQSNRFDPTRGTASESRYSFYEFDRDFPDDAACLEWLVKHLYPEGITCPKCQKVTPHYRVKARPCYACQFCGHHEYPMRGTISAKQLERELGVTYKTAWRMFHKIRTLLADDAGELHGEVEVDETYFNRSKRNRPGEPRKLGRSPGARVVVGAVERDGRVVAKHVPNANDQSLMGHIWEFVLPETMVYTDEHPSYFTVGKTGYRHRRIKHTARVYVMGDVHTQTIEGFWSLLKRGISGAYHSVSAKHLQSYVDEYTFRYNHRKDDAGMFAAFVGRIQKGNCT
jgi:transposase